MRRRWRRRVVDVPIDARVELGGLPVRPVQGRRATVAGAEWYSGVERRLTIWGGTISSISGPSHSGPTGGNSSAEFVVHFTSKGAAVILAWGGHLAQSRYWNLSAGGVRDGAGEVSGSPWHMRTLQLDGSGNRNQDRSIQPSAIVGELPPRALAAPTPTPRPTPAPPGAVAPPPPGRGGPPDAEPIEPPPTAPATSMAIAQAGETATPGGWLIMTASLLVAAGCALLCARTIRSRGPTEPDR